MRHHPPLVFAVLLAAILPCSASSGASIEGRWSGEIHLPNSHAPLPLVLMISRVDGRLVGDGGPNDETRYPLDPLAFAGVRLDATLRAPGADGDTFTFMLGVDGDVLSGEVVLENRHGTWRGRAALSRHVEDES